MIGELAALGAALSWTVSAVLYKKALSKAKPITANIVRLTCTGAILLVCVAAIGKFGTLVTLPMYAVVLACISGIVGLGVGDTLYMVSLKLVGVSRAVPVACTYPLMTLLWAIMLQGKSVTLQSVLGAAIIVFGVWLLSQEEKGAPKTGSLKKGLIVALAAAVMWSVSVTMIDMAVKLPETGSLDNALAINTIRVIAVAAAMLIFSPIIDREQGFLKMRRETALTLISGGIVALGLGWFLLASSFVYTPASKAVPISSTTPLFSTLIGITILHEKVTAKNVLGSAMIVAAIFLIFTF
jgi:drug/metabolite transporter (DMT)-like permease